MTVAASDKVVATTTTGTTPSIFRGSVFVLLRGVVPPEFAVDFDGTALEAAVVQHSGQMLSLPLLDALKSDLAAAANTTTTKRTCYVICWGGGVQHELHPLLAQVKRFQLCDVVPVTPIWLQTCVTEQKCVHPSRMPELFQPSNRPIYAFSDNKRNSNKQQQQKEGKKLVDNNAALSSSTTIRISVTGFSGSQRTAMIHLIRAMGGTYDDSMLRTATTHLICAKEVAAAGAGVGQQHTKYAKAVEWKSLHIVTIEWLYHVARHGLLPDKDNSSGGGSGSTEERFAVVAPAISDH